MLIHVGFHLSARDGHGAIAVPASHLDMRCVIVKQKIHSHLLKPPAWHGRDKPSYSPLRWFSGVRLPTETLQMTTDGLLMGHKTTTG